MLLSRADAELVFKLHCALTKYVVHDVEFEGSPVPQPGVAYPQCLEGERACPPEDVGGIGGYAEYLAAIADPSHERHQEMLDWNGPFNLGRASLTGTVH